MTATFGFSDRRNWVYIASAAYLSFASNFALGYGPKLAYGLLTFIILLSFKHRWAHHIYVLAIALVGAAYFPLAITQGPPDESILNAVLDADGVVWLDNVFSWPLDSWAIITAAVICILQRKRLSTRISRIVAFYAFVAMTFVPFCIHTITTGDMDYAALGYTPIRFLLDIQQ